MDLHFQDIDASLEERAAVDAVLGPPNSAWAGGKRDMDAEGRISLLGGQSQRRDLLLPALHAVQDRFGWLPPGALNYICQRLSVPPAEAYGVATFYHLLSVRQQSPAVVHICDDIACRIRGGEQLCSYLASTTIAWKRSPCLGQCEQAPAALVVRAGETPVAFSVAPATSASIRTAMESTIPDRAESFETLRRSLPQAGSPDLRLIGRIGQVDPESLEAYRNSNGYVGLARAIVIGRDAVIREVIASKLVGRGGAAFPTGRKWDAVANAPAMPHYLVCNADESEPGTFKDRLLMEGDPFAVLEGMTIAAYATGCEKGYLYIRGEYPLALRRMTNAIESARAANLLGGNVMNAGFSFDVEIRRGAGAYICGEETALINSIEGKRGEPRNKPPFPVQIGLFGKPTVINNVETLVNIPLILHAGGEGYLRIGTKDSSGPKLFCLSGDVARPGLYEVAFGPTLRDLIHLAGGVPGGKSIRAVLLGGAAGSFVGPDKLDIPLTFESMRAIGASLGSGVIMVFDETVNLGDILTRIAAFFRDESCGQCVPCRVGAVRQEELLQRLSLNRPIGSRARELALLGEIGQAMRDASICGLGQTASSAIESALAQLDPFPEPGT